MNLTVLALKQHLGDTCSCAKVSVDLKRRMQIKQVGRGSLGREQITKQFMRSISLLQPRPEVDLPCQAPARGNVAANI